MNSSTWDDEAEAYLRRVLRRQRGKGLDPGSVPCAWPTTIFEVSWVLTTFVTAGIAIGKVETLTLGNFLRETLLAQKGRLGFGMSFISRSHLTPETPYGQLSALECLPPPLILRLQT
jgi:hypothetical protein